MNQRTVYFLPPFCLGLAFLLLLMPAGPTLAQQHFSHLSVNDGLSQSTVFSISQDSKGFMWFGTRGGGLNRFDGYTFKHYQQDLNLPESLSDNTIQSIHEDSKERLWVGTRDGGINRYEPASGQFRSYSLRRPTTLNPDKSESVRCIHEDRQGKIWIGSKYGVFVYRDQEDRFEQMLGSAPFPVKGITGICEDAEGNLYFATWDRLIRYHPEQELYAELEFAADPFRVFGGRLNPMCMDSRNRIWLGTPEGLKMVDLNKGFHFSEEIIGEMEWPVSFSYVRTILESREGLMWFGTGNGLYSLDTDKSELREYLTDPGNPGSLVHNSIYSLYEDMVGTLWIGTWSGISVLDRRMYRFKHFQHLHNDAHSLSSNIVSSFQEDRQGIWIGTEQGGLNFMDWDHKVQKVYRHHPDNPRSLPSDNVKSLFIDSNGDLWVGTYNGGLSLYGGNDFTHFMEGHSIYSLVEMPGKQLFIGSISGLYVMDLNTREISAEVFPDFSGKTGLDYFIISLHRDSKDRLWIGTRNQGALLYNPARETVDWFQSLDADSTTLSGDYVINFCEDRDQHIWVGTSNGLNRFRESPGSFERIRHEDGFGANIINGMLTDTAGTLWISTNNGIFNYNSETEGVRRYEYQDGLQSNEFNRGACFMSSKGEMYFGGVYGYNTFRPEEIIMNLDPPPVIISDLKLFNESVVPGEKDSPLQKHISDTEKITLTHRQSSFGFDFVALNYLLPEKNSYAYMLEGYENVWKNSGRSRSVSYMNLKPGSYTFRVKASNNDKVWNEEGASLDIEVKGPPWSSPLAFVSYIVLLSTLLFFLIKTVQYRAHKENELRMERSEKDNLRELNRMRLQFFTNISHEFRTPLTLISSPLEKIRSGNYPQQEGYLLDLMKTNVNRMLRLVNQLMDFRKLENEKMSLKVSTGNLEKFLSQIVLGFEDLANEKMIELKFDSRIDISEDTLQWFDEGILDKVAYNLLSNAFKFTKEQGIVEVSLHLDQRFARIRVKDTGKGIDQAKVKKIFERFYSDSPELYSGTGIGLSLSKKLIDLHKGNITVSSEKGKGASFLVSIPIHKTAFAEEELVSTERDIVYNRPGLDTLDSRPSPGSTGTNKAANGKVILIAEDNPELSDYLAHHFGNYKVILTPHGKEALEQARKHMPDIVLTDIMMPVMDGIELCKLLKSEFLTSHIPVIMLTAKAAVDEKIEGVSSGADAYVEKPFDAEYLSSVVQNLLKQRELLRQKFSGLDTPGEAMEEVEGLDRVFMDKVKEIVTANLSDPTFALEQLLLEIGMSRSQLYRKFKAISDRNPSEYIRILRLQHALELLKTRRYSVNEVAYLSGFNNVSYFNTCFKRHFGKSPGKYLNSNT